MKNTYFFLLLAVAANANADQPFVYKYAERETTVYSIQQIDGPETERTLLLKRTEPNFVSYSRYQFDCARETVRFLGEGLSNTAGASGADKDAVQLRGYGLSYELSLVACAKPAGEVDAPTTVAGS